MKILLLRFSSIGDIVLTTPVIRCLKRQLGAEIHYLTKKSFATVLDSNPHVDRLFTFKKDVSEVLPALQLECYDWVIDLHHNLRSLRLKLALGRPSRSFPKLNFEKWLLVNTGIDRLPRKHIVHRYMESVQHLGVQYDGAGLDYFIPEEADVDMSGVAAHVTPGSYVSFVLGATHATKRLPLDKMIGICKGIPVPVLLLGGPAEAEIGRLVAAAAGAHVINCCGAFSLSQSASVIQQSGLVLTHDTGLMHIAAAFGKVIVSVWGNTVPQFGMYPFYPDGIDRNVSFEVNGLRCRPCSKIGYDACPKGHFRCMVEQNIPEIISKVSASFR